MAQACETGVFACYARVQPHSWLNHSNVRSAIESGRHVERDGRVGWLLERSLPTELGHSGKIVLGLCQHVTLFAVSGDVESSLLFFGWHTQSN